MPDRPDETQPTAPAKRRGRRAMTTAAALAALASVIGLVVLAMTFLPWVLVDESAYGFEDGTRDEQNIQSAYNAVRAPIGVTCAAFLAALAAGAGVVMNARTVAVARETLAQSQQRDEATRAQWRAEHLQSRFQDAASQLGDKTAAVRLAGVLSIAALADDWEERRQPCVDVLCAYARQPLDETDGVERNIRRTVVEEIFKRLDPAAPAPWTDLRINLSGAFVEGVGWVPTPIEVRELVMDGATVDDFFALDHLTVRTLSLDRVQVRHRLRVLLSAVEGTYVSADGLIVSRDTSVHVGMWRPSGISRGGAVGMQNLLVTGGEVTVSLRGTIPRLCLTMTKAHISAGRVRLVMAEGSAEAEAVKVHALVSDDDLYPRASESLRSALTQDSTVKFMSESEADRMFDPVPRGMPEASNPVATPKPAATGE